MKKWESPELLTLGLESTQSKPNNVHYCHTEQAFHENGCNHPRSNGHNGPGGHDWDQAHNSKCCCGDVIVVPTIS